jgi:hypothetical protein
VALLRYLVWQFVLGFVAGAATLVLAAFVWPSQLMSDGTLKLAFVFAYGVALMWTFISYLGWLARRTY